MAALSSTSRKPFSDCTNTYETLNPSQSSSTSTKNSSSKHSKLISEDTGKASASGKHSKTQGASGSSATVKGKGDENLTEPGVVLVPSFSTPSRTLKSSFPEGTAASKQRNLISANTTKPSVTNPSKTQAGPATGSSTPAKGKGNEKLKESGDVLVPSVSTPSRTLKSSSPEGTARHEDFEPSSVYVRRQSAVKIKRKEKEIVEPKSCYPARKTRSKRDRMSEAGVSSLSKSCPPPNRKKQRRTTPHEDVAIHALPPDYIEEQKKYFADIDAFELLEEEVDKLSEEEVDNSPSRKLLKSTNSIESTRDD